MITRIGKYEIKAKLGEGAFGTVYRGYDPRVGRDVAIKVLREKGDADTLTRFLEEVRMTGNLSHKNIVTVHEFGEQDGQPYLVMELLEGENLHDIIRQKRPLSIMQKVQIMLQVADGLYYAHQNRVVHRDVKPANIMVAPDLTVKIMDFGIARITGRGTRQTRQGDLVGTILYMAPELFENTDADPLTDIFSYGDTFYELLTGRQPFFAAEIAAAIYQIRSVDPVRIRELMPECPARLEAIVEGALRKDRDLRYQNLNDIGYDLRPVHYDLVQARTSTALAEVRRLVDLEQWNEADRLVKLTLDLDPANREAWQLHEKIQAEIRKQVVRKHVDKLLKEAEDHIAKQKFEEAILRLESALQLESTNKGALARLEDAKRYRDEKRRCGKLISEARPLALDDLDGALNKIELALEAVPGHPDAEALKKELLEKIARRDRDRREQALLDQARARRSDGDYKAAFALLSTDECRNLNSQPIAEYRARLKNDWFEAELASAEKLLDRQDLASAEETLQYIRNQFAEQAGGSARFARLNDRLNVDRKGRRIEGIRQNVVSLCEAKQFSAAREALRGGLAEFPDDSGLKSLLEKIPAAEANHWRGLRIAEINEKVQQAVKAGDPKEAVRILRMPDVEVLQDPGLKQRRDQLELDLAGQEYEQGLRNAIEEGQRLLDLGQYNKAIDALKVHCNRYREDPTLRFLLEQAQQRVGIEEERRLVSETISRTDELRGARQWQNALDVAREAAKRYPQNPTLKILVAHLESEVRDHERLENVIALRKQIEELIQRKSFPAAKLALDSARQKYPGEPQFEILPKVLERAQNQEQLEALCRQVDLYLAEDKIEAASSLLDSVRNQFAQETRWQVSHREMEKRQHYLGALIDARRRFDAKDYTGAEQVLSEVIPNAPDPRAVTLLRQVIAEREKDQKQKADREREQERVRHKREEVQRITDLATEFNRDQNYADSIRILAEGCRKYPDEAPLKMLLDATQATLRDIERERALQEGLQECEGLRQGRKWLQTLNLIENLLSEYPNHRDLVELQARVRKERDLAERESAVRNATRQAEQYLASGRPDLAVNGLLTAIRDLGPDPQFTALLKTAEQALDDQQKKQAQHDQQVAAGAAAIKEGMDRKDWPLLETKLYEMTKLFPKESIFKDQSEEVRRLKRDDFLQKLAEGRRRLNAGKVQDAEDFVSGKLFSQIDEPEVVSLRNDIAAEKQRQTKVQADEQQRAAFVAEGLDASQACEDRRDLEGALRVLEQRLQRYRDDPELLAAQRRLRDKLRGETRRQLFTGIRQALDATQWPQALELIDRARREYPNDPELVSLEGHALDQRRNFLEGAAAAIRDKVGANKIEDAQTLFEKNLARYPDENIVRAVAEEIAAARGQRDGYERKRAFIAENLKQAEQRERNNEFPAAATILENALKKYPADPDLSAALSRVERKRAEAAKTSAIKKLLDRESWEEALRQLDQFRGKALENPAEVAALETRAREQRNDVIQRLIDEATRLLKLGKVDAAEKILTKDLGRFASDPAVQNLARAISDAKGRLILIQTAQSHVAARRFEEAEKAIAALALIDPRDLEVGRLRLVLQSARVPDNKGPGWALPPVLVSGVALACYGAFLIGSLVGGAYWVMHRSDTKNTKTHDDQHDKQKSAKVEFNVSPPELSFEFQPSTPTAAQKITVTGPAHVANPGVSDSLRGVLSEADSWVRLTRGSSRGGRTEFTVRVLPDGLSKGKHKADLIFQESPKTVHVSLTIPEPPQDKKTQDDTGPSKPLTVQPLSLTFPDRQGSMQAQRITVTGPPKVPDPVNKSSWVKFDSRSPSTGKTEFWVYPKLENLPPGPQTPAELVFPDGQKVRINLTVPDFVIQPGSLSFVPGVQSQTITVTGPSRIPDPKNTPPWLGFIRSDPRPGNTEFTITVYPDRVAAGATYKTELTFLPNKVVHVSLTAPAIQTYEIQPALLNFEYTRRSAQPPVKSFTVTGPGLPEPTKSPDWAHVYRRSSGTGVFQVQILPEKLDLAKDNYSDDVVFDFPPERKVRINLQVTEVAEELMSPIGTIRWAGGGLNQGEDLVIKGKFVLKGGGAVSEGVMASISIDRDLPTGVEVVAEPSQANNFRIHLRNNTGHRITNLTIHWHKK